MGKRRGDQPKPQPLPAEDLARALKAQALELGFNLVGIASAGGSERLRLRSAALQRLSLIHI